MTSDGGSTTQPGRASAAATRGRGLAALFGGAGMALAGGTVLDFEHHPYGVGSHRLLDTPGDMPEYYPIKGIGANGEHRYYHRPDSRDYERTEAEVWFDSPSAAEVAGFTLARSHPDDAVARDFEPGGPGHPWSPGEVETERRTAAFGPNDAEIGVSAVPGPDSGKTGVGRAGLAAAAAAVTGAVGAGVAARRDPSLDDGRVDRGVEAEHELRAVPDEGPESDEDDWTEVIVLGSIPTVADEADEADDGSREVAVPEGGGLGSWVWWALGAVALLLFLALLMARWGDDAPVAVGDAPQESFDDRDPVGPTGAADGGAGAADSGVETAVPDEQGDLQSAVTEALTAAGFDEVEVEIDGDHVRLAGTVGSDDDRAAAAAVAAGVDGVGSVDNALRVEETPEAEAVDSDPDFTG